MADASLNYQRHGQDRFHELAVRLVCMDAVLLEQRLPFNTPLILLEQRLPFNTPLILLEQHLPLL